MKIKEIYEELTQVAKTIGITVRKESGNFRSGFCTVNESEIILINKSNPLETASSVLANCLGQHSIDSIYIKPAIREYIEKENISSNNLENQEFSLEVKY